MIRWKLLFEGEWLAFFIAEVVDLPGEFFCWGKWVNFWLLASILPHLRLSHKGSGDNSGRWSCWILLCIRGFISNELLHIVMIVLLKIYATSKTFGKICLNVITDTFLSNMWSVIMVGTEGPNFLVAVMSNRRGKFKLSVLQAPLNSFP